jgi:hypothetical protein
MHSISERYEKNILNLQSELFLLKYRASSKLPITHFFGQKLFMFR